MSGEGEVGIKVGDGSELIKLFDKLLGLFYLHFK